MNPKQNCRCIAPIPIKPKTSNQALLRMRKAHEAGRGVRLSWEELEAFSVELIGQWWAQIEPDGTNIEEERGSYAETENQI